MEKVKNHLTVLAVITLLVLVAGCSGLSRQLKATAEGIRIDYKVQKEEMKPPALPINIAVLDERLDKDVIGESAKTTVGDRFLGYFAFGVLVAFIPNEPTLQSKTDMNEMFLKAFSERLSRNGVKLIDASRERHYSLGIYIRNFRLDFRSGSWTGEVGYVARIREGDKLICEQVVNEKAKKFNLYGYGSGEEAISEAFNLAINRFDLNRCSR